MRNFMLGCCVGLVVGAIVATVGWSAAQSQSPYDSPGPGLFSEQFNQMQTLSNSTDIYLNEQKARRAYSPPPTPSVAPPGDPGGLHQWLDDQRAAHTRTLQAENDAADRRLERKLREVEHLEMMNRLDDIERAARRR